MSDTATARDAITRLLNAYCFTIDAGDIDAFSRLFAAREIHAELHGDLSRHRADMA